MLSVDWNEHTLRVVGGDQQTVLRAELASRPGWESQGMASSIGYGQAAPTVVSREPAKRSWLDSGGRSRAAFVPVDLEGRSLSSLIESEIIPRLMVVSGHAGRADDGVEGAAGDGEARGAIAPEEITRLVPLALQVEADELLDYVERILRRGVSVDTLLVDLLAPAARLLGEYWEADRCDFVDVTMALWRLQEVVHEIADRTPSERRAGAGGRRALFAAMPGDQHSFGTVVIDEIFSREGWMTDRLGETATSDLLERVSGSWFDLIGLTVSCEYHTGPLPSVITALRNVSRNPRVRVMVGGRVFVENPLLAQEVGADGTAPDARLALQMAMELVDQTEREVAHSG